jgi:hypothetical protein
MRLPSLEEALRGCDVPNAVRRDLAVAAVEYRSSSGRQETGYLIVHRELKEEIAAIFREIAQAGFPVEKMVPMTQYGWSDEKAMADNNTSAFNYRRVPGNPKLSLHACGRAVDINPRLNPYITPKGVYPPGATYNPSRPGTITADSAVTRAFEKRGWRWGGRWRARKDWQHFEKPARARRRAPGRYSGARAKQADDARIPGRFADGDPGY